MPYKNKDLPQNKDLLSRAKELRKAGNLSEVLLWVQLNRKQFKGLDFDRQKVIGNYIVEFYCAEKSVIIEIDGITHIGKEDYDKRRENYLKSLGLIIIRISDLDIKKDLRGVIEFLHLHDAFIK